MMEINLQKLILRPVSISPLISFRVIFGVMMLVGSIRFWMKGWIKMQYVEPSFHFSFYGFDWVRPLGNEGMHILYVFLIISSILIALGWYYRIASIVFFLVFTYIELIDVTYYLNHYYFISLMSFLLIFLPANRNFSLDVKFRNISKVNLVPLWTIGAIRLQLGIVYFFAGLAKLNADWLLEAQPMKIWLPTKSHLPLIGDLMYKEWVAYFFSWFGTIYDLLIVFFLLNKKTRKLAYVVVLIFHIATAIFFPSIGMFPYIMMLSSLVFFSGDFHTCILDFFRTNDIRIQVPSRPKVNYIGLILLGIYFIIQIAIPFRFLLYPDNLFWTEQGYRFSWRVMLMEKAGNAVFTIKDSSNGKKYEVDNTKYLTALQEKMMATQPDLILQYAHYLVNEYRERGISSPEIYADVYVTLNGRSSVPFINPNTNLATEKWSWKHYNWILPFPNNE